MCVGIRVCSGVRVYPGVRSEGVCWCERVSWCEGVQVKCRAEGGALLLIAPSELESPDGVSNFSHLSPEILFVKDENQDCR